MKSKYLLLMMASMGMAVFAQVSSNQSLNGKYYFRQVMLISDGTANVNAAETHSATGTITFDGKGNFTVTGQQIVGTTVAPTLLNSSGVYTVKPGGFTSLTNPLLSGATINARLGVTALVGSSTEAGATVFDLFIAIPAATQTVSTSTLSGAYWISSLEFPNGGVANIRDTNFKLTANGAGSFAENTVTGQAANLGNTLKNQTVGPITYTVAPDATGTLTFPTTAGLDSTTQLIAGTKNIYVSQDGTCFIGGSTTNGIHGLVIGVKAFAKLASNASWNGFYFAAGMRYDTQPSRLAAVSGAVHANGDGNSIWSRRTRQSDGLFDANPLITYSLTGDGSGPFTSTAGHVDVASGANTFSTTGVDVTDSTSYEIYFGALMPPQSGTGVFLHPQAIYNGASFAPVGYPLSPGGIVTVYGTGFGSQSGTASAPFPPTLAGVQMTVNGITAPIYSVVSSQQSISAVVPFEVTGSLATLVVTVNDVKSNAVDVPLAATAPGIFSVPPNGISAGAVRHIDGTLVDTDHPAARGDYVAVYLTGLGAVKPAVQDGAAAPGQEPFPRTLATPNVYVGGQLVTNVQYSGLAPTLAGLYQLNIQIPGAVGSGAQSLAVQTLEGFTDMVTIAIQ